MIIFDGFKLIGFAIMLFPLLIILIINVYGLLEDFVYKLKQKKGKGKL